MFVKVTDDGKQLINLNQIASCWKLEDNPIKIRITMTNGEVCFVTGMKAESIWNRVLEAK